MDVNFLITCFNKEKFSDFFRYDILPSFKRITPIVTLAYNGVDDSYPCEVRIKENRGLQLGEYDLVTGAYKYASQNGITRFVKVSADSWLCDEDVLIDIFNKMEENQAGYAGNFWFPGPHPLTLSTDIFFIDTRFGNALESFVKNKKEDSSELEFLMYKCAKESCKQVMIIQEREPTHPDHRYGCPTLKWTMDDSFEKNVENYNNFKI